MITKKKIRKVFQPLTVNVSTVTTGSPSQVYEPLFNRWTPDRITENFTIQPRVMVTTDADDNTWENKNYMPNVTNIEWYANGVLIENVAELTGCYTIEKTGANNGKLTFRKNLSPSERYDFVMRGVFHDNRLGEDVEIQTDIVSVDLTEKTDDEWDLSVAHETNVQYHPLFDKLKEYDWKVSHGKISASDTQKNLCFDGNQYELHLPIAISLGHEIVTNTHEAWSKVSITTSVMKDGVAYSYGVSSDSNLTFIKSISRDEIVVDLRLVPGGTVLEVNLLVDGVKKSSEFVTFSIIVDDYTCEPSNEGDLDTSSPIRKDKAICTCNGNIMPYPEAYLDIRWFTNSVNAVEVPQGTGECVDISIANAQVGTASNCWLDVYTVSLVKTLVAAITINNGKAVLTNDKNEIITIDMLSN